jgi:predicted  nucleic acid-binding Zn-ribbon protein
MEATMSGTIAGKGSFRCQRCGYVLTLGGTDALTDCPGCGGQAFVRASLFSGPRFQRDQGGIADADLAAWLDDARQLAPTVGEHLAFEEDGDIRVVPLTREWTRVGRSLAADVRFDDPTVSRRHALIIRQPDGVRVLDDRSLNGVFVNGERVEWRELHDGDEIVVGRYHLRYLEVVAVPEPATGVLDVPTA